MNSVVVVPACWGPRQGTPPRAGDAAFDHPTPLDGESTLPRLLESLAEQHRTDFTTLILTAAVADELAREAAARTAGIIQPFANRLRIAQVDTDIVSLLCDDFDQVALAALRAVATPQEMERFGIPEAILREAQARARPAIDAYQSFRAQWPKLLDAAGRVAEQLKAALRLTP